MTNDDLSEFARMFRVQIEREVAIPSRRSWIPDMNLDPDSSTYTKVMTERGYRIVISESQLERLIGMLKTKGFYHDDDYTKRLQEEEIIMSTPELKRLHDEYKMLLYILCGDDWRET